MSLSPSPREVLWLRAWVALQASRGAKGLAAMVVIALIGTGMYVNAIWGKAQVAACPPYGRTDITMGELIAVKKRMDAYQRDGDPAATLWMSATELGFLLQDYSTFAVHLDVHGEVVSAVLFREIPEGCSLVRFEGTLEVDDGILFLKPSYFQIGEADLSLFTRFGLRVRARQLRDPTMGRILANMERMRVHEGNFELSFYDRWVLW